jgi:hypothetical protein
MWNENWEKGEDFLRGVILMFTKKQYQEAICYKVKHQEMHICVSLWLLQGVYTSQKWLKRFLIISGMVGCVLLVQYSQTLGLIEACLLVASVLMLLIDTRYRTKELRDDATR